MKFSAIVSVLAGLATSVQAVALPQAQGAIPEVITRQDPKPIPSGTVPVSVGFLFGLNWNFVAGSPATAGQIFNGLPEAFAQASADTCFNCAVSAADIYVEKLFLHKTIQTLGFDTTVATVHYPEDKVQGLAKMISEVSSPLRSNQDAFLRSLANQIDSEFDIFGTYHWRQTYKNPAVGHLDGSNLNVAVVLIPDLFGWAFTNSRLLADHFAREIDATVFVPDFFGGESLPLDLLLAEKWDQLDLRGFLQRNGRGARESEIVASVKALREEHKFQKVAAAGYCYGGWAAFLLGALDDSGTATTMRNLSEGSKPLVDCIVVGHPSLVTKADIAKVSVPVQILAPEHDAMYTPELKLYTFHTLQARGVVFDYQHFPKVAHACMVRGDEKKPGERDAMIRGKNAAVGWMKQFLHGPNTV
ncbi:Hydrolase tropI [Paramyrothecium foliicola]|nr:Hydrolase tropI [Paramyrothecium foliicola]